MGPSFSLLGLDAAAVTMNALRERISAVSLLIFCFHSPIPTDGSPATLGPHLPML